MLRVMQPLMWTLTILTYMNNTGSFYSYYWLPSRGCSHRLAPRAGGFTCVTSAHLLQMKRQKLKKGKMWMESWAELKNLKMLVKKESSQKQAAPRCRISWGWASELKKCRCTKLMQEVKPVRLLPLHLSVRRPSLRDYKCILWRN